MSDEFVPLERLLAPLREPSRCSRSRRARSCLRHACEVEVFAAARRFRAALADAVDVALQRLLPEIAGEVLGRELALREADVAAIVTGALDRCAHERPVSLRVHPSDLERLRHVEMPKDGDSSLDPGDVILELRSGTIDLRMRARLQALLVTYA